MTWSAALPDAALRLPRAAAGRRAVQVALLVGGLLVIGLLWGERAYAEDGVGAWPEGRAGQVVSDPRRLIRPDAHRPARVRGVPVTGAVGDPVAAGDVGEAVGERRGDTQPKVPSPSPERPTQPQRQGFLKQSRLVQPTLHEQPSPSERPGLPSHPELPKPLSHPELPQPPSHPELPDLLSLPGLPDSLALKDLPGLPDKPALPTVPVLPHSPPLLGLPRLPDPPVLPAVPRLPDKPALPTVPVLPHSPPLPDLPRPPDPPALPALPIPPGDHVVLPGAPGFPLLPGHLALLRRPLPGHPALPRRPLPGPVTAGLPSGRAAVREPALPRRTGAPGGAARGHEHQVVHASQSSHPHQVRRGDHPGHASHSHCVHAGHSRQSGHPGHLSRPGHTGPYVHASAHADQPAGGCPDGAVGNRVMADSGSSRHGDAHAVTPGLPAPRGAVPGAVVRTHAGGSRGSQGDIPLFPQAAPP